MPEPERDQWEGGVGFLSYRGRIQHSSSSSTVTIWNMYHSMNKKTVISETGLAEAKRSFYPMHLIGPELSIPDKPGSSGERNI